VIRFDNVTVILYTCTLPGHLVIYYSSYSIEVMEDRTSGDTTVPDQFEIDII